jgi:protein SCO1
MNEPSRRNLMALAAMIPFAGGLLGGKNGEAEAPPAPAAPAFTPSSPRDRIRNLYFPNIVLRTQDDKPVHFYDDLVKDKVVTINFFFARCENICPLVMSNLAKVQQLLGERVGRDVFMNSISLKPQQDTPAALKAYADAHDARPGWNFLSGKPDDVELLRRHLGFTNPDPKVDRDVEQQVGNVRYGNEPLMLWAACPGQARPEWIVESLSWMVRS